jgi:hypothetical protein
MSWINDELRKLDQSPRLLRKFGLTVGAVILVLGLIMLWRHRIAAWPFTLIGIFLVLLGGLAPLTLRWVHAAWMILALMLGWVVTRIILTVAFYLIVTPIGLLQCLLGKRAVEIAFRDDNVESYWQARRKALVTEEYERQF